MSSLRTVKKYFPHVRSVVDATESILINVSKKDSEKSTRKDPANCALVHACKRQHIADGAIIGLAFSYLIKGDIATRYKTSQGVAREIVTFDRHHKFAAGENYRLSKVSPGETMAEQRRRYRKGGFPKHPRKPKAIHRTAFVRKLREGRE